MRMWVTCNKDKITKPFIFLFIGHMCHSMVQCNMFVHKTFSEQNYRKETIGDSCAQFKNNCMKGLV